LIQIKQLNLLLFSYLNNKVSLNYQIQQLANKQFQLKKLFISAFKTPKQNIKLKR